MSHPSFSDARRGSDSLPQTPSWEVVAGAEVSEGLAGPALTLHATLGSQAGGAVCPGLGRGQSPSQSLSLAPHGDNLGPDPACARRVTATAPR